MNRPFKPESGVELTAEAMTIPNLITSIRIILAPLFIIYLINERFLAALIVFAAAGVSDGIDGLTARLFNQRSQVGAFLDPLADKILLVSAFVVLAVRGFVPPWLTVLVISRDVLILLGALILFLNDSDFRVRPSVLSKMNTCLQLTAVFMVLCKGYIPLPNYLSISVFWMTGFLTISSGLHYMLYWFRMMGESALRE